MMRRIAVLIILLSYGAAQAREGMWLPYLLAQMNESEMKSMGMRISAEDIYSVNNGSIKDAIVHFGGFCTGEVISDQGLIMTNHHCGFDEIQSHSSVENNLLAKGYWAKSFEDELPNPGLKVIFIKQMYDVTQRVLFGTEDLEGDARAAKVRDNIKVVVAEEKGDSHYEAFVRPFFNGNQFIVFITETFWDIRLVGAPPSSIGKYGADTDNWMWPRHNADFSLFRIYANEKNMPAQYAETNRPYKPYHHLPISLKGVQENDFTLVYGFPGRTTRYLPSVAIKEIIYDTTPLYIKIRKQILDIMGGYMRSDAAINIKYASKQSTVSNTWKKWIGQEIGLKETNALKLRQEMEAEFMSRVELNRRYPASYKTIYSRYAELYEKRQPSAIARGYYMESVYRNAESMSAALDFRDIFSDNLKEAEEALAELLLEMEIYFKDYDARVDRDLTQALLPGYLNYLKANRGELNLSEQSWKSLVAWDATKVITSIFKSSIFTDKARFDKMKGKNVQAWQKALLKDPAFQIANRLLEIYRADIDPHYQKYQKQIEQIDKEYMAALMEVFPERTFYPDANSTLRATYGKVHGYEPRDAVGLKYYTTLDGVMAKYVPGDYEFDLPARLIELWEKKDYGRYANASGELPVCFVASNHTSGGNSGSPAINAEGHLIGINFDRVWEGTMSDIHFDESRCRNIMVDARYIVFLIDKFAGAQRIVDELTLIE
jgi:hypothetical protein